jgi:hypothetical protein
VIEMAESCGGSVPCLPYGHYNFTSQSDIDNFQAAFPGCSALIGGVTITSGSDITNLNGLHMLTSIDVILEISGNSALSSLTGLEGLTSIGGELHIGNNPSLKNLIGLDELNTIGGFRIDRNDSLTSLIGLNGLTSIGGPATIEGNYALVSLTGLEGLKSTGNLNIMDNDALTGLTRLQGLTSVVGLNISGNGVLNDLTGLQGLTSIESHLTIASNSALTNLTGLENLIRVSSISIYDNPVLSSLTGLDGLTTIREDLNIGISFWECCGNPALTSLTGLENVSFIGNLNIHNNETLTSIAGIEHLDPDSVGGLAISYNSSLSACNNPFVCNYIKDHSAGIHDNAPGCNSVEEVEEACASVGAEESAVGSRQSAVIAYPNPTHSSIEFRVSSIEYQWVTLKIYNAQGQEVAVVLDGKWSGDQVVRWDASGLPAGIYFYQLRAKGVGQVGAWKIVKY